MSRNTLARKPVTDGSDLEKKWGGVGFGYENTLNDNN